MYSRHAQMARDLLTPYVSELQQVPTRDGFRMEVTFLDGTKRNFETLLQVVEWIDENHTYADRSFGL